RGGAQRMRIAAEQHGREPDTHAAKRRAELQIQVAGIEFDPDASGRRRPRTYGNHIVLAIRNQLPDLFDHLQNQLIRPAPEADHNGLRIFSQQPEYESLEPLHLWLKLEITGVGAVGNRIPTEALLDSPPRSLRDSLPARGIGEQIADRGGEVLG